MTNLFDEFPVSDYYQGHIRDAVTISRKGRWWTAILLIEDPSSAKTFVAIYRWESTSTGWKRRKQFAWRRKQEMRHTIEILTKFSSFLP